jgi:hypothetical protein
LIDARTISTHSPAIVENKLAVGDFPNLGDVIVLEHVFSFPEILP